MLCLLNCTFAPTLHENNTIKATYTTYNTTELLTRLTASGPYLQ